MFTKPAGHIALGDELMDGRVKSIKTEIDPDTFMEKVTIEVGKVEDPLDGVSYKTLVYLETDEVPMRVVRFGGVTWTHPKDPDPLEWQKNLTKDVNIKTDRGES